MVVVPFVGGDGDELFPAAQLLLPNTGTVAAVDQRDRTQAS